MEACKSTLGAIQGLLEMPGLAEAVSTKLAYSALLAKAADAMVGLHSNPFAP